MAGAHTQQSLTLREITLNFRMTLGTSGAVATTFGATDRNDGFGVMTSAGSGVYTLPLLRGAKEVHIFFNGYIDQAAAYNATNARFLRMTTDNVTGATPSITFVVTNSAGTPVQPATSDVMHVRLVVLR